MGWLTSEDDAELAALLDAAAPASYARPRAGRRWAGLRLDGRLAAVAADAWSVTTVGVVAGVATAVDRRGQGLAGRICSWLSAHLLADHGRAALMVDDHNTPALAVYTRLGYTRRPLAIAQPTDHR